MSFFPNYPIQRPTRLRNSPTLRSLVQETRLSVHDLILPIFVREEGPKKAISSMPGHFQHNLLSLKEEIHEIYQLGIRTVMLFGIPAHKDNHGTSNLHDEGIAAQAIRQIKNQFPGLCVISDLCLCDYSDHGHCFVLDTPSQRFLNEDTLHYLSKASVVHARAGADLIAPSGMVDGMIAAIRSSLDESGYTQIPTLSYAAKYASAFYGPFREAAECQPSFGNRRSYQMDPANSREAMKEMSLDISEGADMLMVKPAGLYLDIIQQARKAFSVPIAAYQVSGEYAMMHAAAQNGWLDLKDAALESLTAIQRAGADMILTYFAKDFARWNS
ncbi:MAG: porphobilinogen synthase [Myxococcaceae bacterium]|nr:porphobilinogen synthase [Myxococcaceae bacterium]MBH2006800.1 porphobilinogen synthase [Myxococcaceae bacterium]